ncbi:DinB family protein [Marinigracilibium pacificum]|uniref:DinB family protein n=1 Tax=Marinigracilibium pacificum TaxID=2729599 RepID=A0A848J4P2_9BACT|nr:DinB family protein [Marinigracilibium pacificum]NMM49319.1 DinB family protein [Marinigracilibium pacificum]
MNIQKPTKDEYPEFYQSYIESVPDDVTQFLEKQWVEIKTFMANTSKSKLNYRYDIGKWTIAEVFGHIVEVEKVMGYRFLAFSRRDVNSIPGFNEDQYVSESVSNRMKPEELADWWYFERGANLNLLKSINEESLNFIGKANELEIKTSALPYILAGHAQHHVNILHERYGI